MQITVIMKVEIIHATVGDIRGKEICIPTQCGWGRGYVAKMAVCEQPDGGRTTGKKKEWSNPLNHPHEKVLALVYHNRT
jgi:hypothetical protein